MVMYNSDTWGTSDVRFEFDVGGRNRDLLVMRKVQFLRDVDPDVRIETARALARHHLPRIAASVGRVLATTPHPSTWPVSLGPNHTVVFGAHELPLRKQAAPSARSIR